MDFAKPKKAPGARACPPAIDLPFDFELDDTDAESDFAIWKNILPDSPGKASNSSSPFTVQAPGIDTGMPLAARLHWRPVRANAHPQKWLSYQGRRVPIDTNIAPLIEAMWQAGFVTLACCEGDDTATETAYVMFSEEIGKQFMEWVQAREQQVSEGLTRRFEILLQDNDWHPYMADRYPLLEPVAPDGEGRLFTISWRFHRQELLDHRERLITLLRTGARWRRD